ncbi:SRPBCC family protein [Brevundimonas variabilis]|uniref:Polyketide cyclase n=1 Tax=Brevundimonas variabilis TaxID=74312 RepID=A0A7W9CHG2_9CAUL|nr:SRPBCC family protein [Brevundimonas variabilis]MBB5745669.1 hypothetical protein [Brevundimonas variabilis]
MQGVASSTGARTLEKAASLRSVISAIEIDAPVETIWRVLDDIPSYPQWNRSTRLTMDAKDPAAVLYGLTAVTRSGREQRWQLLGRIKTRRAPEELSWRVGVPGFLSLYSRFAISPTGAGSRVCFTTEIRGFIPLLFVRHFPRLLQAPMDETLDALKRRCQTAPARKKPVALVKKPRHGGPPRRR